MTFEELEADWKIMHEAWDLDEDAEIAEVQAYMDRKNHPLRDGKWIPGGLIINGCITLLY